MPGTPPITEHVASSARHTSFYLACGPEDGTPIVFAHGWPELSISWRRQLRCFGALGFRAIAPDMRGYGRSSVPHEVAAYALEESVADMLELLDALGHDAAIWVGHDLGAPVVWNLAAHHAGRCLGVAALAVPHLPQGMAPRELIELVDRTMYPADTLPAGQWDYQLHYEESFERAVAELDADPVNTVKAMFRRGDPQAVTKPATTAFLRQRGGWFGGKHGGRAPDVPLDRAVLDEEELHAYASALARNGFRGPCAWYLNGARNIEYARRAPNHGRLAMPALFFHAMYDPVCETLRSPLAEPMRAHCERLTELEVPSGHWMAQEQPERVNAGLARWVARHWPERWRA